MMQLTKGEEQIMQAIWQLGRCTVRDIIELIGDVETPHSTVSSIVRILEKKGFVGHKAYGRTYEYFPLVAQDTYSNQSIKGLIDNYFEGSFERMVSFFVKKNDLSPDDIKELLEKLED
jgi:BlaI family penicillinase repressor